jgi:uncharacterized protein YkwD
MWKILFILIIILAIIFIAFNWNAITTTISKSYHDTREKLLPTSTEHYATIFNDYRKSEGLPEMTFTGDLNSIAQKRLDELHDDYSHNSAGGYNDWVGEIITDYARSNSEVLRIWQNSPGHYSFLISEKYKFTGYACDGCYAVQVFSEWRTLNGYPLPH